MSGRPDADVQRALAAAADLARDYLGGLSERHVGYREDGATIHQRLAGRLTIAWNQNAALHALSPAAAGVEQVAGEWMLELLDLPRDASFGFPTGAGLGNAVGLAAARHVVLARAGWDVEARGLYGAPEIRAVVGAEAHATALTALQYLGLGRERVIAVDTDDQGRMRADRLGDVLASLDGPLIVCAQAGNVNSGAFDPIGSIADTLAGYPNAWLHIDGAFGLWAATVPRLRHLVAGVERADSWSTDAHKWLNVGYDCGFVTVRDPEAHRAAMSATAAYLLQGAGRDNWEYVLDSSRRARGFVVWATLRSLGRDGVCALVERCCDLASRIADRLRGADGVEILNDVTLNQVLVRFTPGGGGDADAFTREVVGRVQADGTAWMGSTAWHGQAAMRISVSNWSTTEADADRTAEAILEAATPGT